MGCPGFVPRNLRSHGIFKPGDYFCVIEEELTLHAASTKSGMDEKTVSGYPRREFFRAR